MMYSDFHKIIQKPLLFRIIRRIDWYRFGVNLSDLLVNVHFGSKANEVKMIEYKEEVI